MNMGSIEKPIIMIAKKAVKKDTCKLILHKFRTKELDDTVVTDDNNLVFEPVDETKINNFKYMSEGKKYWSITPGDVKDYNYMVDKVYDKIPEHRDFEFISYIQVIEYPTDTMLNPHKDGADPYDTATAILVLDDDFQGGKLTVDDIVIDAKQGDLIMFNHSQDTWHGVSPIKSGVRTVLALWFQAEHSKKELTEDQIIDDSSSSKFDENSETNSYNALL